MTEGEPFRGNEPDFDAHALEDAHQDVAAGDEIRAALVSVASHSQLLAMIEQLDCEDTGRALLAAVLEDIRRQGRVLAP